MKYLVLVVALFSLGSYTYAKENKGRKPSGTAVIVGTGEYLRGAGSQGPYLQFGGDAGAAMVEDFKIQPFAKKTITFTATCDSSNNCVLENGH